MFIFGAVIAIALMFLMATPLIMSLPILAVLFLLGFLIIDATDKRTRQEGTYDRLVRKNREERRNLK